MKILLYINPDKDKSGEYAKICESLLVKYGIDFDFLIDGEVTIGHGYDAIIVVGGDGTILRRTELANLNNIPIVGINCGRLGFLTEFESEEVEKAIELLKNGKLVKDERLTLKIVYKDKTFYALNDVSFSRIYETDKRTAVNLGIKIGSATMRDVSGDGVIISTPTGSTAYSLSAGGAILEPHINAFSLTPVAAHSFSARPIVFSSDNLCSVKCSGGANAGMFIDGKLVAIIKENETVFVSQAENKTVFLRKSGFDFFTRLNKKMQDR